MAIAFCGATSSALQLLIPLSSALIINQALPNRDFGMLARIAAGLAAATLLSLAAAYGEFYFGTLFRERLSVELQRDLFEHIQRLPISFFKSHDSGYVMARITSDSDAAVVFPAGLTGLGRSLVWFIAAVFLVPVLHPMIGLVVMLVIPLYAAILVIFKQRIKSEFLLVQERTAAMARELHESLVGVYETKAYGDELYRAQHFAVRLQEKKRSLVRGRRLMALAGHSTQVIVLIVSLFILIYGGVEVMQGKLSLGELVALNALAGYLLVPVNSLVSQGFQMQKSLAAVERLNEILEQPGEPLRCRGRIPATPTRAHLRFSRVGFQYCEGEPVLRAVDFEVQPGETVLFLGPSGVGKSTLMALLPRFCEPCEGRIFFDGRPIRELDLCWLRSQIAFVSQETFLFSDSVFNNIRIGNRGATREDVREAAQSANALDFIEALPEGFDTKVGERGCRLSGGQRQRIAIARAILKGAPVLVLDEATSAVDRETEAAVYDALDRLIAGRTTLVVAHHSEAFLNRVDRVLSVCDGRVLEVSPEPGRTAALAAVSSLAGRAHRASVGPARATRSATL